MKIKKVISMLVTTAMMISIIAANNVNKTIVLPLSNAVAIEDVNVTAPEKAAPTPFGDFKEIDFSFRAFSDWYTERHAGVYERLADFLNNFDWGESTGAKENVGSDPSLSKYLIQWTADGTLNRVCFNFQGKVIHLVYRDEYTKDAIYYQIDLEDFVDRLNELLNVPEYIGQDVIDELTDGIWESADIYECSTNTKLVPADEASQEKLNNYLKNDFVSMLRMNKPLSNKIERADYCIKYIFKKNDTYEHREIYYIGENGYVSRAGYDFNGSSESLIGSENFSIDKAEFEKKIAECGIHTDNPIITTTPSNSTVTTTTTYSEVPTYTNTQTIITTTSTTSSYVCTYQAEYFKSVASYPTKTVYDTGESLDISGLVINTANGNICAEEYFAISRFAVTDENGRSVNGDEFSTLPAGEYTVSHTGNTVYRSTILVEPDFSYKVTIMNRSSTTTTSTLPTPVISTTTTTNNEPEVWMYGTGVDHFESIKTLPTKTIYKEGDKLDLRGLVINAYHSVSRHSNKGRSETLRTDYVWEIEEIAPDDITIADLSGNTYKSDEFANLKGGCAYVVKFGKEKYSSIDISVKGDQYEKELYDVDKFTFRVYIDPSDKNSRFIRIDNAKVESFEYGSASKGLKLENMDAFSIDTDAYSIEKYRIESDLYKDDLVSGVLYIEPDSNYVYFGDLEIVKYGREAGDVNCDGEIDMADAVLIMQSLSNPDRYGINGTDTHHITKRGQLYGDVDKGYKGITSNDALRIQQYLLKKIDNLEF